jgi:hypothetical protein
MAALQEPEAWKTDRTTEPLLRAPARIEGHKPACEANPTAGERLKAVLFGRAPVLFQHLQMAIGKGVTDMYKEAYFFSVGSGGRR